MQLFIDPLSNSILQHLLDKKWLSPQELYDRVKQDYQISLSQFYKILDKLIANWILTKEKKKLYFHNRWILGMVNFTDQLRTNYTSELANSSFLQTWQVMMYEASTLESLDKIRLNQELAINRMYGNQEPTYFFTSHPYYMLGAQSTEISLVQQTTKITDFYYLCGNTHFLDTYGVQLYQQAGVKKAVASDKVPFLKEGYCLAVVGDFVFEVLYPPEISDYFRMFFETVKELKDFNVDLFQRIFEMKTSCKLTLRRDTLQAKQTKKMFHEAYRK